MPRAQDRVKSRRYCWYGSLGAGKTLCAVRKARDFHTDHPDLRIFSNIKLNLPFVPINSADVLFDLNEPCFVLLDELWALADSRKGTALINDVMNMLLLRSRKRGWVVSYTEQWWTQVDLRIRYITDYWCEPEIRRGVCIEKLVDKQGRHVKTTCFMANVMWKLYDDEADPYTLNIKELKARWTDYRRKLGIE